MRTGRSRRTNFHRLTNRLEDRLIARIDRSRRTSPARRIQNDGIRQKQE
jgi:hypothetical protein